MDHDWRFDERGEHNGKPGEWHRCSGCGHRVFYPDGHNDFQRRLAVAMAWMEDVGVLGKDEIARRTVPNTGEYGMDRGYHGVLSQDCEEAQRFNIESVMVS